MTSVVLSLPEIQRPYLTLALTVAVGLFLYLVGNNGKLAALFAIGIVMGVTLYHASFGFTGAYRRAILEKDISGVTAQLIMLAVAMLLFAPVLSQGEIFGHGVVGAVAPVSVSMAFGALIFGIGMQLAGGCGSGTLFTAGGGNPRMVLVLVLFCVGGFWGSLDLGWWSEMPGIAGVSLGEAIGWGPAVVLQLTILALIYLGLRRLGAGNKRPLWTTGRGSWAWVARGPWPLLLSAGSLALLNWMTLLIAGHPWSITWAFALWGAKAAVAFGWSPETSVFWSGGFPAAALNRPVLEDVTSVMDVGIILGAFIAAALAGKIAPKSRIPMSSLLAAVVGGLLLGYGARLAYGCNIGAFFSGVASTSLHGWVWILFGIIGNFIGVRLRPHFRLGGSEL